MGRQLLDVEHAQAVAVEDRIDSREREIREVLVVDRVELALLEQPHAGAGTRTVTTPSGLSSTFIPATKSFRSGTCASTLFPISEVGGGPCCHDLLGAAWSPKKRTIVGIPLSIASWATFVAGSTPEHRDLAAPRSTGAGSRRWTRSR